MDTRVDQSVVSYTKVRYTVGDVFVHPRVHERHPELTDEDVLCAWENCILFATRADVEPHDVLAIGCDSHERLIEMIATRTSVGSWAIYHAFTPPTKKFIRELNYLRRY